MDLGLKDKVIVITGGAEGIGGAISEACLREGAIPVLVNADSPAVQSFAQKLCEAGARFELLTIYLDSPEACKTAVDETLRRCGSIDAMVNNAGVNDKVGSKLEPRTSSSFPSSAASGTTMPWHITPSRR